MSRDRLELVLFSREPETVRRSFAAGIRTFIVDWELRGKHERQQSRDTEIDPGTAEDLERVVCSGVPAAVWCRLNAFGPWTRTEVESAVAQGASNILLPMVRTVSEVERFLDYLGGRCSGGILVETDEAVARLPEIARLPVAAVYVGLNDLAISRGYRSLFDGVLDGTVERVREAFPEVYFGFGGVTTVDRGQPVPCLRLLEEMERLRCGFSFLRRSFRRDIAGRDAAVEVARIHEVWSALRCRSAEDRERDLATLHAVLHGIRERPA